MFWWAYYNELEIKITQQANGFGYKIIKNKKVLIKPNLMSQNRPDQHTITHYSLVGALCRILKEANCEIVIGESISFYQSGLTRKAFKKAGIEEIAKKESPASVLEKPQELILDSRYKVISRKSYFRYLRTL